MDINEKPQTLLLEVFRTYEKNNSFTSSKLNIYVNQQVMFLWY